MGYIFYGSYMQSVTIHDMALHQDTEKQYLSLTRIWSHVTLFSACVILVLRVGDILDQLSQLASAACSVSYGVDFFLAQFSRQRPFSSQYASSPCVQPNSFYK